MPKHDPMEIVIVTIVCSVQARYDQQVTMTRKHAEELIQKIDDEDDVEDEIMDYLDMSEPIDATIDFGDIDTFEIVTPEPEDSGDHADRP